MKKEKVKSDFYEVVIVGAGLSGIGAAYHLKETCSHLKFTILEARASVGGTWDLFKYPGLRSDSDMYTFGYAFHPWKNPKAIADGPSILKYINETADIFNIREHIQFNKKVISSSWSSSTKKWTIEVECSTTHEKKIVQTNFLFMCSGYYNYENGYEPEFPNFEAFKGIKIHPQKWDTNLDYKNKNVIIIGSGATAITLLPELAKKAKEVTMLQRSPTYIMNLPSEDVVANFLKKILPAKLAHKISRWKNILFSIGFYRASRKWPKTVKNFLKKNIKKQLGGKYEDQHFNPKYKPWDQRLCLVPDNDLFKTLKDKKAKIVTDTIRSFTTDGITLNSGEHLPADIIITATGLKVQLFGGMKITVDGTPIDINTTHAYKGVMLSEIPNFALAIGYTNASWTLKCDLNCQFIAKVLNHMKQNNYSVCTPKFDPKKLRSERLLDFDAGYILRASNVLPKQGSKTPWKVHQNYIKDLFSLKYSRVTDKYLEYQ
ncbi:flavin-containing monooxygenase [Xanthovirga aplysinae]|uniref:flavin-containing monooxygenase n=1 Tax=Xanthovirga aplysinae TaxID=2529853 RepID=UPI0012BC35AA|nr:NAD(P)/FAD-dependent oxidoreductase [Xanthovirga aplysinae]MTI32655.1 NAD(P)/FAD-dependent oxidoreductase [Xanthovirga aplysinae]